MSNQDSIFYKDPDFYSAYDYVEQEESGIQKVLFLFLLIVGIVFVIYYTFSYLSSRDIDLKKFNFFNLSKQSEPFIHESKKELKVTSNSKIEEEQIKLKKKELELIVRKVIEDIYKEKLLNRPKVANTNIVKPTKKVSHKQEKKPYLVEEYLEAIKRELEKN